MHRAEGVLEREDAHAPFARLQRPLLVRRDDAADLHLFPVLALLHVDGARGAEALQVRLVAIERMPGDVEAERLLLERQALLGRATRRRRRTSGAPPATGAAVAETKPPNRLPCPLSRSRATFCASSTATSSAASIAARFCCGCNESNAPDLTSASSTFLLHALRDRCAGRSRRRP